MAKYTIANTYAPTILQLWTLDSPHSFLTPLLTTRPHEPIIVTSYHYLISMYAHATLLARRPLTPCIRRSSDRIVGGGRRCMMCTLFLEARTRISDGWSGRHTIFVIISHHFPKWIIPPPLFRIHPLCGQLDCPCSSSRTSRTWYEPKLHPRFRFGCGEIAILAEPTPEPGVRILLSRTSGALGSHLNWTRTSGFRFGRDLDWTRRCGFRFGHKVPEPAPNRTADSLWTMNVIEAVSWTFKNFQDHPRLHIPSPTLTQLSPTDNVSIQYQTPR